MFWLLGNCAGGQLLEETDRCGDKRVSQMEDLLQEEGESPVTCKKNTAWIMYLCKHAQDIILDVSVYM